ncbi:MAG: L-lactate dehydrogenase [Candidatus Faecenecus gallistercoris]|nr:L-lactate dehydrogenase [Bacillota bacterium]MDD7101878.1 L-lactate dehydrogenase [Bacillota bacterium]MDY4050949.1 L-lactate dehydrogenase [Candidatus Faecenecus gallistercoris]
MKTNNKVVIIGCGNVGMSYAYALLNQRTYVNELVLIDLNQARVIGEVMDLNHCLAFAPSKIKIKAGDYQDCSNASIVVIAAGANQNPGETRMDLIHKNSKIFKGIVSKVVESGFHGVFLVATNPLDVMTYLTYRYSGFEPSKVIGSGTSLDTARLRYLISEKIDVSPKNVHAYVVGEHGDSEFVPWSNATIGLQNIQNFLSAKEMDAIADEVKNAAYEIIKRKGATYYGIGMCLVRITNAILGDENTIITVSTYDKDNDVYVGLPTVLNRNGADKKIYITLNLEETNRLQKSIDLIRDAIASIKK